MKTRGKINPKISHGERKVIIRNKRDFVHDHLPVICLQLCLKLTKSILFAIRFICVCSKWPLTVLALVLTNFHACFQYQHKVARLNIITSFCFIKHISKSRKLNCDPTDIAKARVELFPFLKVIIIYHLIVSCLIYSAFRFLVLLYPE